MVSGAGSQAADMRTDILGSVPSVTLQGSSESVANRCSILKIHAGGQSVRIHRAVQFGCKAGDKGGGIGDGDRRPSFTGGGGGTGSEA